LPESLDETYERVLREIKKSNREDVYRLLQCLVVSIRPLRVKELAEVLAIDFDGDEDIPMLKPDWRWEDQEEALQAACSSLIAIVDIDGSRVVQFSHFSVKEFLTSPRLADSSGDVSRYHISPEPAHTILARACIGVLLRLDDGVHLDSSRMRFPLAGYAAEHWVKHAQFENVSSRIRKGMEELFNLDRPHFATWRMLHDVDTEPPYESAFYDFGPAGDWDATPLYYAARCGFHDLVEHLVVNHPEHVNARGGGPYIAPLVAALAGNYFRIAQLLLEHGADVNVRGDYEWTPLLHASWNGNPEIVEWLLNHGADKNARSSQSNGGWPSLHLAAQGGHPQVAQILLERQADINAQTLEGCTPLHIASQFGKLDFAELLLGHGVDVNARDNAHSTPLHLASGKQVAEFEPPGCPSLKVVCLLLKHGADVEAKDDEGKIAFHFASSKGLHDIAKLLSEHGTK
jgi:ankyrin repeat protein